LPESPERAADMQHMTSLRERTSKASRVVLVLVTVAMLLMTLAHYI
jgi:hypothetical protein